MSFLLFVLCIIQSTSMDNRLELLLAVIVTHFLPPPFRHLRNKEVLPAKDFAVFLFPQSDETDIACNF